jgi:hypothetical protein
MLPCNGDHGQGAHRMFFSYLIVTTARCSFSSTDVDAFYKRDTNAIFIPSAILQPPFFSVHRSACCTLLLYDAAKTVVSLEDPCRGILVHWAPSSATSLLTASMTRAACSTSTACTGTGGPTVFSAPSLRGRSASQICTGCLSMGDVAEECFSCRLQLLPLHKWAR